MRRHHRRPRVARPTNALIAAERLLATRYLHWLRADTYTTSGANLATLTNRGTAGGNFAVSAGVIAEPTVDAACGGQKSFTLSGTQWLDSSLAASSWRYPHDGTGYHAYVVFVQTTAATRVLLGTRSNGAGAGMHVYHTSNAYGISISNAGSLLYNVTGLAGTSNVASLIEATYSATATPKVAVLDKGAVIGSSSAAGTPAAGDPTGSMRIGASASDNAFPFVGRIADIMITNQLPTIEERSLVRNYVRLRYGF